MTTITWPSGIPFIDNPSAFRESGPMGNVIRTPMEHGPSKTRRRFTAAVRQYSGETDVMTNAQVSTFETWFDDTIASGALSFTATNPRSNVTQTFKITDPYEIIHINDDENRISLKLERQP